ncbi:MAG: aspartate kinase [bacterium]
MAIVVQKYGGTSVGTIERIKNVAVSVAAAKSAGNNVVVVVSAMGDTTDELIDLLHKVTDAPDPREYDMLISTGEQVSAALVTMAIHSLGFKAVSLTGWQAGVQTEDIPSKARITHIKLDRIQKELKEGRIVVVTGFQGIDSRGDITTIGRGGSDTSAVVIAAALGAEVCEIYTDVDGVYTADPRIVKDAKKLKFVSYDEMLELASLGAQVLHPRSIECAKNYGLMIHLRSSISDVEGTYVSAKGGSASGGKENNMEKKDVVSGVAIDANIAKVGILKIPDKPGIAAKLFKALGDEKINVDMIIQSIHSAGSMADMAFTVAKPDTKKAVDVTKRVAIELGAEGVVSDDNVAKVSIVGVGMISNPGVAGTMFEVLGRNGVNIEMISTSEIKISCVVKADQAKKAMEVLHKEFNLGK